jgi:hypothetical protein
MNTNIQPLVGVIYYQLAYFVPGSKATRVSMGFPKDWERITKWLYNIPSLTFQEIPRSANKVLCPDLPVLGDYYQKIPETYWNSFPYSDLPTIPLSKISPSALQKIIDDNKEGLLDSEIKRANTCIGNLEAGASSFQKTTLPACYEANASGIESFGKEVSDAIASWITKGFESIH